MRNELITLGVVLAGYYIMISGLALDMKLIATAGCIVCIFGATYCFGLLS